MRQTYRLLLPLLSLAAAGVAQAEEEVVEPVAVTHPRYSLGGRFEVSASATLQIFTHLTQHGGLDASVAYNILEVLAVEIRGGYTFSRQTGIAADVSRRIQSRDPSASLRITDDFSNLWQMGAHGLVGVRYTPFYGKLSLFSEVPVHYQAYLWAGAGVGMFQRTSLVICADVSDRAAGACADPLTESRGRFLASFAIGWRFFTHAHGAVKFELRNYLFPDAYRVNVDRVEAEAGRPTGQFTPSPGVTPLFFIEAGYAFIF